MHQIRLFKNVETGIRELEKEINDWLKQSKARVVQVTGNIAPQSGRGDAPASMGQARQFGASDVLIAVVYETP